MTTFTIPALCNLSGIDPENKDILEEKLNESRMFVKKQISVDTKNLTLYELSGNHKLFLIFALLAYAKELWEYQDSYSNFMGDDGFFRE